MATICFLTRLTRPAPPDEHGQPRRQLTLGDTVFLLPEHAVDQVDEQLVRHLLHGHAQSLLLARAAQYGLVRVVQRFLGTLPRTAEDDARALRAAAANGFPDVVRALLGAGVPPSREAAVAAAKADNPSCLALLLDDGWSVLPEAALAGSLGVLRLLQPLVPEEEWHAQCARAFQHVAQTGSVAVAESLVAVAQPAEDVVGLAVQYGNAGVVRVLQRRLIARRAALLALRHVAPAVYAVEALRMLIIQPARLYVSATALADAARLGHVDALSALLERFDVPPLAPHTPLQARMDAIVRSAIRRVVPELPGTALRRAVTTFCLDAFQRRMGVLLSFRLASGVSHEVALTARGILWSIADSDLAVIPRSTFFDHIVEGNSYEIGAVIAGAPPLDVHHFWSVLESCCRVMDSHFLVESRFLHNVAGKAYNRFPSDNGADAAYFSGEFSGVEFTEGRRLTAVDWLMGPRADNPSGKTFVRRLDIGRVRARVHEEIWKSEAYEDLMREEAEAEAEEEEEEE